MKKYIFSIITVLFFIACEKSSNQSFSNGNTTGQGGSLARFTIVGNYLYTIDGEYLSVFDISNAALPVYKNKLQVGFNIEALFPFKNKLFIASNSAMYVYNISNPETPVQEANVAHFTGCDPVVANDNTAFLTVHGGTRCNSTINQLQVYDINNMYYPSLLKTVEMTNPMGLGLKDSFLFVCDNGTGLKVFNVQNPSNPKLLYIVTGENFVDVIPMDQIMVCMLTDGVAYFDISNPNQIVKLGTVKN
jgi:hypothetical protein